MRPFVRLAVLCFIAYSSVVCPVMSAKDLPSISSQTKVWEMFAWKDDQGNWHYSLCSAAKSSPHKKVDILSNRNQAGDAASLEKMLIGKNAGNLILRSEIDLATNDRNTQPVLSVLPDDLLEDLKQLCTRLKIVVTTDPAKR
jgi:hypothetical protein